MKNNESPSAVLNFYYKTYIDLYEKDVKATVQMLENMLNLHIDVMSKIDNIEDMKAIAEIGKHKMIKISENLKSFYKNSHEEQYKQISE